MGKLAQEFNRSIKALEAKLAELKTSTKKIVQSEIKRKWTTLSQNFSTMGTIKGMVLNTIDPLAKNRVQFFSPFLDKVNATVESLPWAFPVSSFGGIDDSGVTWIPPAGSMIIILFENGDRNLPYYIGTTWPGRRTESPGYTNTEYEKIHEGHREGYFHGPDRQFLPPWNTENINRFDFNHVAVSDDPSEERKKLSYPHVMGLKTPQKHSIKFDDGDYKCYHRWKRIEIQSSLGGWMCFKDDPLHPGGQWGHPDCGSGGEEKKCVDDEGNPVETVDCEINKSDGGDKLQPKPANKYAKNKNECRAIKGPLSNTSYQNNKIDLPQLGIQILSHAGGTLVFDDSVDQPNTIPEWEKVLEDFPFGCTDKFTGKTYWQSPLGHLIKMNDVEDESKIRGKENGISIITGAGNYIKLNDHTIGYCTAGEDRGIRIGSTSLHELIMADEGNEQCSPTRKEGGVPIAKANKAFVKLKSGYGIEVELNDSSDQSKTVSQFFRIHCPQKDNKTRGPHQLVMIETKEGPGQVVLRAGGDYVCSTYDNHMTIIGDKEKNPANKYVFTSDNSFAITENDYINVADMHLFLAKEKAFILAGEHDQNPDAEAMQEIGYDLTSEKCTPTIWPVLCLTDRGITISDRVFVSASKDAGCASIFHLTPFHTCKKPPGCDQ